MRTELRAGSLGWRGQSQGAFRETHSDTVLMKVSLKIMSGLRGELASAPADMLSPDFTRTCTITQMTVISHIPFILYS